jgi:hypothetical protein
LLQAKLSVSQPGDLYEEEADRVAEQVMRMPESSPAARIQRMCAGCEEELQREATVEGDALNERAGAIEPYLASLPSRGQPLPEATRAYMEPRFGVDFGQVRVHTDNAAAESARGVDAVAFTVGRDIVFGAGRYAPESEPGRRLLAHELTHVIQQGAARPQLDRQAAPAPAAPAQAAPAAAAPAAAPATDAAIEALDLAATAKNAAYELKKKRPAVGFTSGRRSVSEQARAMAANIVSDGRKWIEETYSPTSARTKLQDWVDAHPEATTVDTIGAGLEEVFGTLTDSQKGWITKHITGEAFDVQPQTEDAEQIKADIQVLPGITKFLEREGGLVRWHAQFKRAAATVHAGRRAQSPHLQRFATCETAAECPPRASGERARSRSTAHAVEDFASPVFGVLISNFAVDDEHAKADLLRDLTWIRLMAHMGLPAGDEWEILGFTDCEGAEGRNRALRLDRANEVAGLMPGTVRALVRTAAAAPIADCITDNSTEAKRARNRSVLVRRLPGSRGPAAPAHPPPPIGPVRPPGAPGGFCVAYTSAVEAAAARLWLETVYLEFADRQFGTDVHALWRDYLSRPKGATLAPRVFAGRGHRIVDAFRTDPETVLHRGLLFADIAAAAARTPEANIPVTGTTYTSPPIPLGTLLPPSSLRRSITYTDGHVRIPGNIAGGTGSSDAGPDLRLFTGSVRISRTRAGPGAPEVRTALIDLQLQVIDAVDFCPGAPGGTIAQAVTIPMSRLEATPTEPTYDLPFHVFVDLSGREPIP